MANKKQTYNSQPNKDDQNIDIKQVFYVALNHWYLFLIFIVVALAVCFAYNRYTPKVYQTSGTVLIKERNSDIDPTSIMTTRNFGGGPNLDNEIAVLRSYTLTERVVKKMNIEVTYFDKGRIAGREIYKNSPFHVEFESSVPQAVGLEYEITFLDNDNIRLHAIGEGLSKYDYILCQESERDPFAKIDISGDYKLGAWIDNGYNRIRITKSEEFKQEASGDQKMYFWLNSYPSLVAQMGSFSVGPLTKQASVASVSMQCTNKQKIVDFVNLLMNEYVNRGLEKKNLVSENTIAFIDNELSGIQESLSQAETDLKDFRQ